MTEDEVLMKIGDVSKEIDLPIHVIRFWETKFSFLNPIKKPNGTRYYSKVDLVILKKIKFLLYEEKYSINGANLFLKREKNIYNEEKKLINEIEILIDEIKFKIFNGA
tara:strand:- start:60 stop:383 length:324 start_codon:yes stop_codon:yes gene_type:complete